MGMKMWWQCGGQREYKKQDATCGVRRAAVRGTGRWEWERVMLSYTAAASR